MTELRTCSDVRHRKARQRHSTVRTDQGGGWRGWRYSPGHDAGSDLLRRVQLPEVLPAAAEQLEPVVVVDLMLQGVLLVDVARMDELQRQRPVLVAPPSDLAGQTEGNGGGGGGQRRWQWQNTSSWIALKRCPKFLWT